MLSSAVPWTALVGPFPADTGARRAAGRDLDWAVPRDPEIAFTCPACGEEAVASLDGQATCRRCGATPRIEIPDALRTSRILESGPACGNALLYVQRDFNQKAGLGVVIVGAVLAPFTPFYSSLFVAAAVDAALYAVLPDVTVCYRCHAHMRGFARNPRHHAFDLHLAEQYDVHESPPDTRA
jgi:predicted RNA-binding Zn-ribbon protein involved in translation (DUF1610 family)